MVVLLLATACDRSPQPGRAPDSPTVRLAGSDTTRVADAPAARSAPAAATVAAARPAMPRVLEGFCQGESCDSEFQADACVPVELRAFAADTAPVAARIERGDTVQVRRRDLHIVEPGRVVIRRDYEHSWDYDMEGGRMSREDTLRFAAGDTVYLLHYHQLGWWAWWHRGRESNGHEFWVNPEDGDFGGASSSSDSSSATAVALTHPRTVDWWLVELRSGRTAWWRRDSLESLSPMGTRMGGTCRIQ